jgi:lantibiotic modifying enzyme
MVVAPRRVRRERAACASVGTSTYGAAAVAAANWLKSVAMTQAGHTRWPAIPSSDSRPDHSLYYGTAGIIGFFIDLFHYTGQTAYLAAARRGAAAIAGDAAPKEDVLLWHLRWNRAAVDTGLYLGGCGIAVGFHHLFEATHDEQYLAYSVRAARAALPGVARHSSALWNGHNDVVSGAAGIGLCLLRMSDATRGGEWLDAAIAAGDHLLRQAVRERGGCWWPNRIGDGIDSPQYPNFSHGVAGIAFFLARLYERTQEPRFLEAALDAATWLQSIRPPGTGAAWCHHAPQERDLFYVGWCHGPAGTARFFYQLYLVTRDVTWLNVVTHAAAWIGREEISIHGRTGLWNYGMCCGVAGVGDFFLNLYATLGDQEYKVAADHCAQCLLNAATPANVGIQWIQAEHRIRPDQQLAQTGYAQGAAGIGLFLLRSACVLSGRSRGLTSLPDNPFVEAI